MAWCKVDKGGLPVNRPVMVRTLEGQEPVVAFLSTEGIWYAGGALVQNSMTVLGAIPTEWCEPQGEERL